MRKSIGFLAVMALGALLTLQATARSEETPAPTPPAPAPADDMSKAFDIADAYAGELMDAPPEGLTKGDVAMAFGWVYLNGVLGKPDYDEAVHYYEIALEEGMPEAGTTLGAMHLNADVFGIGDSSVDNALSYYEEAAGLGSADANFVLGRLHYDGEHGLMMNPGKGGRYLVEAARRGNEQAIARLTPRLGQAGFPATPEELVDDKLAEARHAREEHFEESAAKIIELLEHKLTEAGVNVGALNFDGSQPHFAGMTAEEQEAYWHTVDKATEDAIKGIIENQPDERAAGDAALIVGVLQHLGLLHGHGQDKALEYMTYALERKVPEARVALGEYYLDILPPHADNPEHKAPERDVEKGLEYLNAAAADDSVDAYRLLGMLYADGVEGVAPDAEKSREFLLKAAKHGDQEALDMLEPVFEEARAWEQANPGKKSPLPTGADGLVDEELAKKAAERRKELGALAEKINNEIDNHIHAALGEKE